MRTVKIEFLPSASLLRPGSEHIEEMFRAIGYLSHWGASKYDEVLLARDRDDSLDIIAYYYDSKKNGEMAGYVIGAIWNESIKKYSYHS